MQDACESYGHLVYDEQVIAEYAQEVCSMDASENLCEQQNAVAMQSGMTYCFKFKAKHDEVVGCNFDGHERPVNTI